MVSVVLQRAHACCCVVLPVRGQRWTAAGRCRPRSPCAECCVLQSASLYQTGWGRTALTLTVSVKGHRRKLVSVRLHHYIQLLKQVFFCGWRFVNWPVFHPAQDPSRSSVSGPHFAPCRTVPCRQHSPSPSGRADFSHWKQETRVEISKRECVSDSLWQACVDGMWCS